MASPVLKHGGTWMLLSKMLKMSTATFQSLIVKYIHQASDPIYNHWIDENVKSKKMTELFKEELWFRNYPFAKCTIDIIFQQCNRPYVSLSEAKSYSSGKQKLFGYKNEVNVSPPVSPYIVQISIRAEYMTSQYSGKTSRYYQIHRSLLDKTAEEICILDDGERTDMYPHWWGILLAKAPLALPLPNIYGLCIQGSDLQKLYQGWLMSGDTRKFHVTEWCRTGLEG